MKKSFRRIFSVMGVTFLVMFALAAQTVAAQTSKIGIEMIRIPGGTFQMGKELGESQSKEPVHAVTLSDFSMSKYPVTQEQYQAVMGKNPSKFSSNPAEGEVQEKRPVENVSWYDAIQFCNKLSAVEGLQAVYTIKGGNVTADFNKNGYRLPTEAQWEYAAKGGNPNAAGWKGYMYSGSNTLGDVAWYDYNSGRKTHEVGKKKPNGLGLYDMTGNVNEWCWDWEGSDRVLRGGCWGDSLGAQRSVNGFIEDPSSRNHYIGFRLVRP